MGKVLPFMLFNTVKIVLYIEKHSMDITIKNCNGKTFPAAF
ncbi:hypothetical protein TPE_2061 [Treponema pedis str. T A4]|uniref:Uncharacterized protein n=1 Tax=Treponema pedis str. T A4 TaxID=1291379 RepID=S5ZW33_9SPIR|nr:hypothetical protein TPE_2061 [Treponema pedis str. T A4]